MHIDISPPRGKCKNVNGTCVYRDITFTFAVHKITKKEYSHAVEVHIISPATGRIHQSKRRLKKNRDLLTQEELDRIKAGKTVEKLNAQKTGYISVADNKSIQKKVEELVRALYGEYQDELHEILKDSVNNLLHARTAYDLYSREFLRTLSKVTEKTLAERAKSLEKICNYLDEKPINDLTKSDVEHTVKNLSGDISAKLRLAEKFFDYLGEMHVYGGQNPITRYLSSALNKQNKKNRSGSSKKASTHLPLEIERKLHNLIAESIGDPYSMAIPLVKGFRMPMDRILDITWGEIQIEGNNVLIPDYKDAYTGGTHNYIRPPTRETADYLLEKYKLLQAEYPLSKLKKMKIVSVPTEDKKNQKSYLTAYYRRMLKAAGVDTADLTGYKQEVGGGAYTLLCRHYDYVLRTRCGVNLDSGVGCYLRAVRIYDVTSDHYRCFNDATGLHYLQTIMDRDNIFQAIPTTRKITTEKHTDYRTFTIPSSPPGMRTTVVSKKRLFLPQGSTLILSSPSGLEGNLQFFLNENETITSSDFIDLY